MVRTDKVQARSKVRTHVLRRYLPPCLLSPQPLARPPPFLLALPRDLVATCCVGGRRVSHQTNRVDYHPKRRSAGSASDDSRRWTTNLDGTSPPRREFFHPIQYFFASIAPLMSTIPRFAEASVHASLRMEPVFCLEFDWFSVGSRLYSCLISAIHMQQHTYSNDARLASK